MNEQGVMALIVRHAREIVPGLENHDINGDDSLRELGANSVDRSEIIMMTLESLDLQMHLVELARAHNIGELASLMHGKLQSRSQQTMRGDLQ